MAELHDIARARKTRCPICGQTGAADHRPFCSARCKQVDLGRWLGGAYRVPTEEAPDLEEVEALMARRADAED